MKRLFVVGVILLGCVSLSKAQTTLQGGVFAPATSNTLSNSVAADFASTSATQPSHSFTSSFTSQPFALPDLAAAPLRNLAVPSVDTALAVPLAPEADPAEPSPKPKFLYGGRDDYRFQLGISFSWIRFRSSIYNASAVGIDTSLAYYTNDWFAIEGAVSTGYAPEILDREHVKLLFFGAGPKIAWRQRRWEPWLHGLVGALHAQPQTAGNSKIGFAVQAGGGADYRVNPRFSGRLEADWIRSNLFGGTQNNFQLAAGIVIHF